MLIKTFVFSILGLSLCFCPLMAEETVSLPAPKTEATPAESTPHLKRTSLTAEQREKIKEERKARRDAWIKEHPEQLKQMQENRAKRQQWMKDHPEEAKKLKEEMLQKQAARRAKMLEQKALQQ